LRVIRAEKKPIRFTKPQNRRFRSGVARFFSVHDTKNGNNVPNAHEMYQMVIKYPKRSAKYSKIYQHLPKQGPKKLPKSGFLV
jgi:hypothetical protein